MFYLYHNNEKKDRTARAKLNIVITLLCQLGSFACAFMLPRWQIRAFGSEVYGATTSIAQFLAYITLLEGGIGGVARAALYKPLAEQNTKAISSIVKEVRDFFRVVAYIFFAYVLVLGVFYKRISHFEALDWTATFWLVIVISLSTFAEYFVGITYSVLIQAAQRTYVINLIKLFTTVLNAALVFVLIQNNCDIIQVKLGSSLVFIIRPILMNAYAHRLFHLEKNVDHSKKYLTQKWTGLGQHIAFFLHSNTDIAILTVYGNLKGVAVYSVYNMIIANLQNIISSFSAGMEANFGDMIAKNEIDELNASFTKYETLISLVATIAFSAAYVLILPFVKVYTAGIRDTNYIDAPFAFFIILAALVYCIRQPYHAVVIAAGHFRQTQTIAYGEAAINILLSVLLINRYGLAGIAFGTLAATAARLIYYAVYLSKRICKRPVRLFLKRLCCSLVPFLLIGFTGNYLLSDITVSSYLQWILVAIPTTALAALFISLVSLVFYKKARKDT